MNGAARRDVLRLAAAALLLNAGTARATARPGFAPPGQPLLYTRRLERALADGNTMAVERRFAVHFVPVGDGFRIDGTQRDVLVEAPPPLAEFARLERERIEAGVFPIRLDAAGTITGGPTLPLATKLDTAVRLALGEVTAQAHSSDEKAEHDRFILAFQQGAARLVTELPGDLFAPGPPRRETREVALPNGDAGAVSVAFAATRDEVTGIMREARREIVTTLEATHRSTLESWTLGPLLA